MPGSSCPATMIGCTGSFGLSGTIASQLLQHAFGVGNVGDHEPRHARKQRDGVDSRPTPRLLEVEDHRHVVALAEFVPQRVEDHLPLRDEKRPRISTTFDVMVSMTLWIFSLWSSR